MAGGRPPPVRRKARTLAVENSKWRVWSEHIADDAGREVRDYLVVAPHAPAADLVSGVTVVPVRDGDIVLLDTFRHPVGRFGWEVVRGFVDAGEAPERAALRELAEEAGLVCPPEALVPLGHCLPESSLLAGRAALYAATDCRPGGTLDEGEIGLGARHRFPLDRVRRMLASFEIEDATTTIALHRYLAHLDGR